MPTINTTKSTPELIITSTKESIEIIETILYWEASWAAIKKHTLSHCLLRIYNDKKTKRVVVIASELNSNRGNINIGPDFEALAKTVIQKFGDVFYTPLSQVIWIKHYGRFSQPLSYDTLGERDSFYKIEFSALEISEIEGKGKETVLNDKEVKELMERGWFHLRPVERVLSELFDTLLNNV